MGGGAPAFDECPSGQVLYGFQGRSGELINQVVILCIPWRSDIGSNGAFSAGTARGGTGGKAFGPVVCPGPLAVTGIEPSKRFVVVGTFIARFRFVCEPPPGM